MERLIRLIPATASKAVVTLPSSSNDDDVVFNYKVPGTETSLHLVIDLDIGLRPGIVQRLLSRALLLVTSILDVAGDGIVPGQRFTQDYEDVYGYRLSVSVWSDRIIHDRMTYSVLKDTLVGLWNFMDSAASPANMVAVPDNDMRTRKKSTHTTPGDMYLSTVLFMVAFWQLLHLSNGSALPDLQQPSTRGPPLILDLGNRSSIAATNERPVRFTVPTTGGARVTLYLDWHLTKFEQRETNCIILCALDRLVQTTIRMTKGDEPILNGQVIFRSPSLKLTAKDSVLLGGFTYSTLSTAIRGLGELLQDWGANGVDADIYVGAKKVGTMDLDFLI
ncbi:MAG: hypothetical protein Q9210_006053 [Variospora velana]